MNPEFYHRVREIYHAACELSGTARYELLERECAGDQELLAEVESLLSHDDDDRTDALSDARLGFGRKLLQERMPEPGSAPDGHSRPTV